MPSSWPVWSIKSRRSALYGNLARGCGAALYVAERFLYPNLKWSRLTFDPWAPERFFGRHTSRVVGSESMWTSGRHVGDMKWPVRKRRVQATIGLRGHDKSTLLSPCVQSSECSRKIIAVMSFIARRRRIRSDLGVRLYFLVIPAVFRR